MALTSLKTSLDEHYSIHLEKKKREELLSIFSDEKQHKLADLLPNNTSEKKFINLQHRLSEYKLLLIALQKAQTSYKNNSLSDFDSLVGENSCQIRATILCVLNTYIPPFIAERSLEILYVLDQINIEIQRSKNEDLKSEISLREFLDERKLHIKLTNRELFLLSSYILTMVRILLPSNPSKQIVRNESTVTSNIKKLSPVGSTFAREFVKHLRKILSEISVRFVQDVAKVLPLPDSIYEMVTDRFKFSYNKFGNLSCLPCFWYTFILIKYSLKEKVPLIFTVKQLATDKNYKFINQFQIAFKVIDGRYKPVSVSQIRKDSAVISILGSSCKKSEEFLPVNEAKEEILKKSPEDLILAYAAAHRQYPDETKEAVIEGRANYKFIDYYLTKAHEWGCSLKNPSLFFLVHAYSDKLENILI